MTVVLVPGTTSPGTRPPEGARAAVRGYTLIGGNGDRVNLSNWDEYIVDAASSFEGFGMPPVASDVEETLGVDGGTDGDLRVLPRPVSITVRLGGKSHADRSRLAQRLARALHSKTVLPSLEVTTPGGVVRAVTGRYTGGAEAVHTAVQWGRFPITLRCAREPFWVDAGASTPPPVTWKPPVPHPWFPFPGWMRPGSGQVLGGPVVVGNDGDVELYPDWLLAGPATGLTLSHLSTGRVLKWNGTLPVGKWLMVITQPGSQEVVDSDGTNRYYQLDQVIEPDFWTISPGENTIQSVVDGAGETTSITLLNRRRRWLTAG